MYYCNPQLEQRYKVNTCKMKNLGYKLLALFVFVSVFGLNVSAQNGTGDDVSELKDFIRSVYETGVTNLNNNNVTEFLVNFDKSFVGSRVDVALDGKVEVNNSDYSTLVNSLKGLSKSESVKVTWVIQEYHSAVVKGKTGAVSFDIQYSLEKNGQTISSGTNSMDVITRKTFNGWRVSYSSTIQVEETRNLGNCYCEIYSQGKTDFLTQLLMPDGSEYLESTDKFKIITSGSRRVIRVNGEDHYDWDLKTGEVLIEGKRIGEAKKNETAIKAILKFLRSERCQRIVTE